VLLCCCMPRSAPVSWLIAGIFSALVLPEAGVLSQAAQNSAAQNFVASPQAAETVPHDPESLMILAARLNRLTGEGIKPWHLKASFKLLDEQGNTLEDGHIEEFWAGPHKSRLTYTSTDYAQTTYWTDTGTMRSGDKQMPPVPVLEMRNQFVQPLPDPAYLEHQSFDMRPQQAGSAKLSCLAVKAAEGSIGLPALLGHVYCLDEARPLLRISAMGQAPDHVDQYVRNKVINFQGHFVPQDIRMVRSGRDLITAHLDSIELLNPVNDADFTPPPDAIPLPRKIAISAGVAQGNLIRNPRPEYPQEAKAAGVSGTVVIEATIGKDGRISDAHAISGSSMLRQAAVDAVKNWAYKPYLLNGEAVEVDTTINVVFSLGR
jgi:TonB family protein